ncbi:MAG: TonB-dependent receptor, partial [Balneolaceae bacterium]
MNRQRLFRQICAATTLALCSLLTVELLQAQSATVQGIVSDAISGDLLSGAHVILEPVGQDDFHGQVVDQNGFYQIAGLQPGAYTFRISFIGYIAHSDTLELVAGETQTHSIRLLPDDELLDELIISQEGGAARLQAGRQRITAAELRRVPTPAAGGDLATYLQAMPGVVSAGDRGGQLYIRGGTPTENLVLVDGTMIYQPFHIIGFFSVFPSELVSGADFYAGGFPTRYNSRLSSVLDVRMRDGDRNQNRFSGSASPYLTEFTSEGPLEQGRSSWIASVRHSLIEQTSPLFMTEQQPLRFDKQYLKMTHYGVKDSRCSAMAMRTYDRGQLDYEGGEVFQWKNVIVGGRCVILPVNSDFLFDINAGFSHISNGVGNSEDPERFAKASRANLDANITRYVQDIRLDYGLFVHIKSLRYDMSEQFTEPQSDKAHILVPGVHFRASIPITDRLQVIPGTVVNLRSNSGENSNTLQPRLQVTWQPFGRPEEELNAAIGLYRQSIAGISDTRDASTLFTAWVPQFDSETTLSSIHTILGWNQELRRGLHFSIEGYHKRLSGIPVAVWSTLAKFSSERATADGNVYGGDFRVELNRHPFYGFIGYGLTWTKYSSAQDHFGIWFGEPVQEYHPPHDRRHQLNTHASLQLGSYTIGLRWQLGSGLPFTQPIGFDELHRFRGQLPDVDRYFGERRVILDKPYQGRLTTYHRLDVSLEREVDT